MNIRCLKHVEGKKNWIKTLIYKELRRNKMLLCDVNLTCSGYSFAGVGGR